ncbi:MAG: tail fiber domain-containing protein [Clostridiales bacterium]|nr:tail fiber domain-containing protein [Clostridiales bacterium]
MSIKATGQITISAIADLTYEDICTHDTATGLIECTHAQDQGCVRITEIQGKSEQVQSTQGKNLFNGVFHDGFIDLNTGAITSSPADNPSSVYSDFIRLYSGKSYIVSGHNGQDMRYRLYNLDGSYAKSISFNDQYTSDGDYYVRLLWYQGLTNEQKSKIQLEEGTTATAYEPFTPNSPSPDYPSVINSIGDSGKLNVVSSVGRRNLIPNTNQGKTGWYWSKENGSAEVTDTESFGINACKFRCITASTGYQMITHNLNLKLLKLKTKYTVSFDIYTNMDFGIALWITRSNATGTFTDTYSQNCTANKWTKVQGTITSSTQSVTLDSQLLYMTGMNKTGIELIIANLQMVEGDPTDKYSPAPEDITPENSKQYEDKLSLASVNLTSPLRSLPNGIHDVLECKDGVWGVTRNCGLLHIDETANFATHNNMVFSKEIRVSNPGKNNNNLMCSRFKKINSTWGIDNVGIFSTAGLNGESIAFRTPISSDPKVFFRDNPTDVVYELITPTWEPLDDPSQKALNNLLSYSGKDYIFITDPLATNFSVAVKSRAFYENFKLQEEIKNTNTSLDDLDDEIKGGFYDGIINTNEAEAIRKAAETMHTQVTNQFNKVDSNPSLTGAPKTTHQTKYTECNNAYNTLISKINTAIDYCSVNSTKTDAQKKTAVTDMNTAFGTYKTKLADYQKAYQDAIDAIAKKKADDAVDGVVIGGRNLFRQSGHWEKLPDTKYWGNNGGTLSLDTTVKYLGYNTLRTTVGNGINGHNTEWIELDTNKIYTYSAMILTNANVTGSESTPLHYHCAVDKNNNTAGIKTIKFQQSAIANQWTLLYVTFQPKGKYWRPFVFMGSGSTIFNIAYLKLEEGTKATDWAPNSEDADEKINQVSATLTSTINEIEHTVDKNTKSITDKVWKTDIITGIKDLNVGGINLWDLSAIKGYNSGSLSTLTGATVDAKTGKITVTTNSVAVPGCKIDTSTLTRNTSNIGELVVTGYYDRPDSDSNKFENVYLYYKCFNSSNAEVQTHTKISLPIETSSKLFAATISIPANTAYINFGVGQIPYVKPYTLTGVTVKDSALYDITKGLRDQVSQAYQDISGFKQTVSDTYTTKTEFDQLSIGGRNLLLNSGRVITTTTAYNVAIYETSSLKPNTKYTFVINGFTNSGNSMWVCFNHGNSDGKMFLATTTAKTQYIVVTTPGTLNSTAVFIYNYPQSTATSATINWACMYEGEIKPPLDWTPAPEDIDEKFTNYTTTTDMNSLIDQTKENIELGVSRTYTSKAEGDKITQGLNKWILEVYQLTSSSMPNPRLANIENIRGKVPTKIVEVADTSTNININVGDYYIGHAFTYLYFDTAYTWSGTIITNEEGAVYLNGVKKVSTAVLVSTNVTLPFQAGWNVLEIVYNEGGGDDGWLFSSKLSTLSQCKIMNCYAQVSLNASALIKVTADAINSKVENNSAYSEVVQNAGKIKWLVASGKDPASMELTPEALNVVVKHINLNGDVKVNGDMLVNGSITAEKISANSINTDHLVVGMNPNLVRYGLDTMEQFSTVPYFSKSATATVTLDDSQYYIGTKSIKFIGTSDSNSVCLGSKETDYGCVPVISGKTYILSCYVKTTSTSNVNAFIGFVAHPDISASNIINHGNASKSLKNTDGWVRLSIKYTASSAYPYASIRINVESPSYPVWFDAFQIEEVDSEDKEPGTFKQAGTTTIDGGNITTGIMKSANYNYSSGNFTIAGTMIDLATGVIRSKGFGMDASGNSYFNGNVTATTLTATTGGKIAGWNIKNSCLWKGSSVLGSTGKSNIYLGDEGISFSDKFIYETETGELEINGKILASSGQIGGANGFNIKTGAIWRGSETWGAAGNGNIYLGVDGFSLSDKLKYKDGVLEVNGVVNATSGSIGGWNITTGSMNRQFTANGKNYWLYFDTGTTSDAFAAFMLRTKATTASAWEDKFSIAWNGKMTAMDADVRGTINAISLQAKDTIKMYSALTSEPATILQLVKPGTTYTYDVLLIGDGLDASSYLQFQRHAKFTNGAIISAGGLLVNNNISAAEIYASQHHISSYDGGWFMQDSTWVRSINNKSIYTGSQIMAGNAIYEFGTLLSNRYQAKGSYSASSHTHGNIINGIYSWNISGTGNLIPRKNGTDTAANIGANSTTGCVNAVYYKSLVNKSDRRFKENIRDISLAEALTIVENLNIKSYNYKDDKAKIKNYGILGQELRDLLIESSHELFSGLSIDDRYEEGRPVYDLEANEEYVIYGVNYTQFIPLLIKAMQYVLKEIHKD